MKKILWLASWYPSRMDESDGDFIQRQARAVALFCKVYVIYVVKEKDKLHRADVEINTTGNLTEQIIYYSPPATGIKFLDRFLSHRKYKQCFRKAIREYINANGKPDDVHVHVAMKAGLAALWMKKKWGIPFIVSEHWTGYYTQSSPSVYQYNPVLKSFARAILKEARLFLPVSKDLGETVKHDFINIHYQVIPNVVDTKLFYYRRVKPAKFRFIHVSYMNYQKNPEGILAAAAQLKSRGYDFELLMLGKTTEKLSALANEYGLANGIVSFIDAVPYAQVASYMQEASALLLFSRFENLPCVVLEALCCGLPVISSRVGGIAEVVDAANGILVETEHIEALALAMQQLMDNYHFYQQEGIAAAAAAKFNYEMVGKQLYELYL